jgi:ribosomal protein S6E (S10)
MNDLSTTTEPSMYERAAAPEWPLNALPKHWVEALFSKMSAFYGARFADMWRGSKVDEVQKAWAVELFKLSREQLKAGSESLTAIPKPPTLPEFVALCKQARAEQAAGAARQIEHTEPANPKVIAENMGRIQRMTRSMRFSSAHPGWAYDFLMRGTALNGQPMAVETPAHCRDAVLSTVGRAYAAAQTGERAAKCAEILARCMREAEVEA